MTIEELQNIIVYRASFIAGKIHDMIVDGVDSCCDEYKDHLCNIWRLYTIQQIIANNELLDTAAEVDSDFFQYISNSVNTIGGYSDDDFFVADNLFLSFFQYYNQSTSNGSSGNPGGGGNDDDCICFEPVNGVGRNFENPTLYNQLHDYADINQFVRAFLFPAVAPNITSWSGSMIINAGASSGLTLIEKGTIVRDITATMIAARNSSNSALLSSCSTTLPSPSPASPVDINPDTANHTQIWTTTINGGGITTWDGADKSNKSFTATVVDTLGKTKTSGSIGYSFGNYIYTGVGIIGTVDETFIKSLSPILATSPYRNPLNFNVGNNQHAWVFYPDAWGNAVFTDNSINIAGGFTRINGATTLPNGEIVTMTPTILLTFTNGYTELYRGYITDNHSLGSISFRTAS